MAAEEWWHSLHAIFKAVKPECTVLVLMLLSLAEIAEYHALVRPLLKYICRLFLSIFCKNQNAARYTGLTKESRGSAEIDTFL